MQPTLVAGDRVFIRSGGRLERLDIVALHPPGAAALAIKRIAAIPGDRVQITRSAVGERVLVQPAGRGTWLMVSYVLDGKLTTTDTCCPVSGANDAAATFVRPVLVPSGKFFVLGDNPRVSEDSRSYGFVDETSITGRAAFRVWPPGRLARNMALVPAS
jgi:signal peptidase I